MNSYHHLRFTLEETKPDRIVVRIYKQLSKATKRYSGESIGLQVRLGKRWRWVWVFQGPGPPSDAGAHQTPPAAAREPWRCVQLPLGPVSTTQGPSLQSLVKLILLPPKLVSGLWVPRWKT